VMVSGGVDGGIVTICKRTDTGGLTHAPSAVDTLITHIDAATPRAIQELADHWPMKSYTIELPLQATPAGAGLIEPGTVIDFADGEDDVVFHVGEAVAVGDALEFKEFVDGKFQAGNAAGAGFRVSVEGVDAVEKEFQ